MEDKILKQIEEESLKLFPLDEYDDELFSERYNWRNGAKFGYNIKESVRDNQSVNAKLVEALSIMLNYESVTKEEYKECWKVYNSAISASPNTVSNEGEKWVSVDDRLPEAYETIISYNIHTDEVSTDYIDDEKRWDVLNPTHWMPLPKPPKEK